MKVSLSDKGLRRAYGDNAALLKSARLHEACAAVACHALTIVLVFWFVNELASGVTA